MLDIVVGVAKKGRPWRSLGDDERSLLAISLDSRRL